MFRFEYFIVTVACMWMLGGAEVISAEEIVDPKVKFVEGYLEKDDFVRRCVAHLALPARAIAKPFPSDEEEKQASFTAIRNYGALNRSLKGYRKMQKVLVFPRGKQGTSIKLPTNPTTKAGQMMLPEVYRLQKFLDEYGETLVAMGLLSP